MAIATEHFKCRTVEGTYHWFQNYAYEHGYLWGNKTPYYKFKKAEEKQGSVGQLLSAISYGEFILTPPAEINKIKAERKSIFTCRVMPATFLWFKEAAYNLGYLYDGKGAVSQLLEAIVTGEVKLTLPTL